MRQGSTLKNIYVYFSFLTCLTSSEGKTGKRKDVLYYIHLVRISIDRDKSLDSFTNSLKWMNRTKKGTNFKYHIAPKKQVCYFLLFFKDEKKWRGCIVVMILWQKNETEKRHSSLSFYLPSQWWLLTNLDGFHGGVKMW